MKLFIVLFLIAVILSPISIAQDVQHHEEFKSPHLVRPIPYPIDVPDNFKLAVLAGTRTETGEPGSNYWQQFAEYDIEATLNPETKMLNGIMQATYFNNSPNTLYSINMELALNVHQADAIRLRNQDITDGKVIHRVAIADVEFEEGWLDDGTWLIDGTQLIIRLNEPLETGGNVQLQIEWETEIPQQGASGRMGWDEGVFFVGYWYPQFSVYDDVYRWMGDQFMGNAEFYHGFANYNLTINMPENWVVMATGEFVNPEETLAPQILERYLDGTQSDDPVAVIREEDFGNTTLTTNDGMVSWKFKSEDVRDIAFSATNTSNWDTARTSVGDLTGNGENDYTIINAFWRNSAPLWRESAAYAQHSVTFLSEMHGFPYPWPHMTTVEGGNIIGGGMEYPMMTLIGDYNARGAMALYSVTAHEIAHMWFPMIISTNERRYTWIDEGNTVFATDFARHDYFPSVIRHQSTQNGYINFALTGGEGELMRWSDFHTTPQAYRTASYPKPASILVALKGVLGEDIFWDAYKTFTQEWAYKHPYPWDMWNTFERVSGQDLGWFWRTWYYETWMLDHSIKSVEVTGDKTLITIEDLENAPMPVLLRVSFDDGTQQDLTISQNVWLNGNRTVTAEIDRTDVIKVEIDPEHHFPDIDRYNNVWER